MRVPLVPVAVATGWLLLSAGGCAERSPAAPPSILLVVMDTVRADAVSAYGAVDGTTPNFDALARSGRLYSRAYAPSPWTVPSHASLFTGDSLDDHGVGVAGRVVLAPGALTLAERLRSAGYETAAFSENALISSAFGFEQGFDHFAVRTVEEQLEANRKLVIDVQGELESWLETRDRTRPFFVFINLYDAHEPYEVRQQNPFVPSEATGADAEGITLGRRTSHRICDRIPNEKQLAIMRGLYLGEVARADRKMGQALALLRDHASTGLITVVTSDHGEHFGEHRLLDHEFSVRDVVLRVPLVVQGPGLEPASIEQPVELRDVTRSLLGWAGADSAGVSGHGLVPDPAGTEPASLLALYSDRRSQLPAAFHSESAQDVRDYKREACGDGDRVFGDMVGVTRYPFKLNWYSKYPSELFDLARDPGERVDLAPHRPKLSALLDEQARAFAARSQLAAAEDEAVVSPEASSGMSAEAERALRALGYLD